MGPQHSDLVLPFPPPSVERENTLRHLLTIPSHGKDLNFDCQNKTVIADIQYDKGGNLIETN